MEIISRLVCCFLSSVRTAEHTVTTSVVEKFIKGMEELKAILGKLGTFLISKKHVRYVTHLNFRNLFYAIHLNYF